MYPSLVSKATFKLSHEKANAVLQDKEYLIPKYPTVWDHSTLQGTGIPMPEQPQPKAGTKLSSLTTQTNILAMKLYGKQHVSLYSVPEKKTQTNITCAKLAGTCLDLCNKSSTLANRRG